MSDFAERLDDELLSLCPGGCGRPSLGCECPPFEWCTEHRVWDCVFRGPCREKSTP